MLTILTNRGCRASVNAKTKLGNEANSPEHTQSVFIEA
jgi:hypothetical protein